MVITIDRLNQAYYIPHAEAEELCSQMMRDRTQQEISDNVEYKVSKKGNKSCIEYWEENEFIGKL